MRKHIYIYIPAILFLSCEPTYHANRGNNISTQPNVSNPESKNADSSDNYDAIIKTYKPETAEVLSDLLNGTSDSPRTSIIIDNKSNCNLVVTVKGGNILKKIPATKGKLSYVMIEKNQNYTISGNLCGKNFKQSARIYDSYTITLK